MQIKQKKEVTPDPYQGRVGLVYVRVSSVRQTIDGNGLQSQEERCVRDLATLGVPHCQSFPDSVSGAGDFMLRPAMRKLLEYIDNHPRKKFVVVFDDLKRFARDTEFHLKLRKAFRVRDVTLRCLNYNFDDSPEGEYNETMFAAQGQLERKQNRRQVIQKMGARMEAGYWPFGGKKGYDIVKDPGHGKLCRPNNEGQILREGLEAFASRILLRKIDLCRYLVERGVWRTSVPERFLDKVAQILQDPFYAGYLEYPRWQVERTKGKHEALISLGTYERIQRIIKKGDGTARIRRDTSPDFPLRGLIVCDHCGSHLTAAATRKRFPYYACHNKNCERYGKSIRKDVVESCFLRLLQGNSLKPEVGKLVEVVFERVWDEEVRSFKTLEREVRQKRLGLEEKASKLTDAIFATKSLQVKALYERQLEGVAMELEAQAGYPLEGIDTEIPYRTALDKALILLRNPYLAWQNLNVQEQHRLFFFLFDGKLSYNQITGYRTDKTSSSAKLFEEFVVPNTLDVDMPYESWNRLQAWLLDSYNLIQGSQRAFA